MTALVRQPSPDDALDMLRTRVGELETELVARVTEFETLQADLEQFRQRYRQEVGVLHDQLDEIELAIAEAELGELSRHVEELKQQVAQDATAPAEEGDEPASSVAQPARFTSDAVRKLFREVAKAVHPDLAADQATRDRLHSFMVQANRAYALGDAEQLQSILDAWERSPEAVRGTDPEATRTRLERRVMQLEEQLAAVASEVDALHATSLWELKVMVDQAAVRGKDLIRQMVDRLKRDIMVATNRLDAMRG